MKNAGGPAKPRLIRARRGRVRPIVECMERRVLLAGTTAPVGLTPAQVRHAYAVDQVTFGAVAGDGTGQTIAVVGAYDDPSVATDLHDFDVAFGLPDPPSIVRENEYGGTMLPGLDPAGPGFGWEIQEAMDVEWAHAMAPGASILLVEANAPNDTDMIVNAVNTARNAPGVVAVMTGYNEPEESGETSLDQYFTTPAGHVGVTFLAATGNGGEPGGYPAYSPNVVAVGATTLSTDASGDYLQESSWYDSGGGISKYESQPAYQKGVVTQSTTRRAIPDFAFNANPITSGVPIYDSYDFGNSSPWAEEGGTSLAAACWAGIIAIADQGRALAGFGSLDGATQTLPLLYAASGNTIHDIINGYLAGPGYDLISGRGTPIANLLIPDLVPTTTTAVVSSDASVVYGQQVTFTATVSPAGAETGTVQFQADGSNLGGAVSLGGATAAYTTTLLNAGSHSITAIYSGDVNYATSTSPAIGEMVAMAGPANTRNVCTLASFNGANGENSEAGVAVDSSGDLFGTTTSGGSNGDGTVYEIAHGSGAITVLATFNGANGSSPYGGLVLDSSGNLFGATYSGGISGWGTVFEIAYGSTTITTLGSFNGTNGQYPYDGVTLDSSDDLFGTTYYGGYGTVFEFVHATGVLTSLASFGYSNGAYPYGSIVLDTSGDIFGATAGGGFGGVGAVFEIVHRTGILTITGLASFNVANGQNPAGTVILDSSGDVFGTTGYGGASSDGTVFEVANGSSAITDLASFNGADGSDPYAGVIMDSSGNLFGTTIQGGADGDGTVFEIAHGSGVITTLLSLNGADGAMPYGGLTFDSHGNLFGTTFQAGGVYDAGTVFELTPTGTVVTSSNLSTVIGQAVTFTATVTPNIGAGPTGTVQFQIDNSNVGSPVPLSGNLAVYTTSALDAGSYSVAAVYSGDNNFVGTTSSAIAQTVAAGALSLAANTVYFKLDADGRHTDIWNSATAVGPPAESFLVSNMSAVTYAGSAGGDLFVLDLSAGDPLPGGGFSFAGGSGQNTMEIIGTPENDTAIVTGSSIILNEPFGTVPVAYSVATTIIFNGGSGGADTLIQAAQPGGGASVVFANPTALDTLDIDTGTITVPANAPGNGPLPYTLGTLLIAGGAGLALAPSDSQADQTVLSVNNPFNSGTVDIANNTLVMNENNVPLSQVTTWVRNGDSAPGIYSSRVTGPGAVASRAIGYGDHSADPFTVPAGDVEVKYVPTGDTNLDGVVDITDLTRAINDLGQPAGYSGGDILNQGIVNISDIAAIINDLGANLSAGGDSAVAAASGAAHNATPAEAMTPAPAGPSIGQLFSDQPIAEDWLACEYPIFAD